MLRTAAFVTGMEQILRREYGLRRWAFGSRCRRLFFLSQRLGTFIMEENGPHLLFTFTKELLELD